MKKLILTYKSGRHRKEIGFEISDSEAEDPIKRAIIISTKKAAINGPVVNWRIEE